MSNNICNYHCEFFVLYFFYPYNEKGALTMISFLSKDFLLSNETAKTLYHQHAAKMPIYDYHCHLDPKEIYEDVRFENITQVWLAGDHYKWRIMRSNGVAEE